MSENIMPQNREYMAKCAADSFMQSLMMRNPTITESEELYLRRYMEIFNKSLDIAERMQKESEARLKAEDELSGLFK